MKLPVFKISSILALMMILLALFAGHGVFIVEDALASEGIALCVAGAGRFDVTEVLKIPNRIERTVLVSSDGLLDLLHREPRRRTVRITVGCDLRVEQLKNGFTGFVHATSQKRKRAHAIQWRCPLRNEPMVRSVSSMSRATQSWRQKWQRPEQQRRPHSRSPLPSS